MGKFPLKVGYQNCQCLRVHIVLQYHLGAYFNSLLVQRGAHGPGNSHKIYKKNKKVVLSKGSIAVEGIIRQTGGQPDCMTAIYPHQELDFYGDVSRMVFRKHYLWNHRLQHLSLWKTYPLGPSKHRKILYDDPLPPRPPHHLLLPRECSHKVAGLA